MKISIKNIVDNIEKKLNSAIVEEIKEAIKNNQTTPLQGSRGTVRFKLHTDTGKYKEFDYLLTETPDTFLKISSEQTNFVVYYINGIVKTVESNIEGVESPNLTFSAVLEFAVPCNGKNKDLPIAIRDIVDNAFLTNDINAFNGYSLGISYTILNTGTRDFREVIGDSITYSVYISYSLVANGVNSSEIELYIDGLPVLSPRKGYSRVSNQEADIDSKNADGNTTSTTISSVYTVNFDLPTRKSALDDIILLHLHEGKGKNSQGEFPNMAHLVTIVHPQSNGNNLTINKIMCFNEVTENTETTLNASNTVTLVEAMTNSNTVPLSNKAQSYLNGGT